MTRLSWDLISERNYEVGVDRGVLYPKTGPGMAWNGLVSVKESSTTSEVVSNYIDGMKFRSKQDLDSFSAAIVAYFYPESLDSPAPFGFSYRTMLSDGENYKLHIIYNAFFEPFEESHGTINADSEVIQFGWSLTTLPKAVPGHRPSAHFIIDTRVTYSWVVEEIENLLYGNSAQNASLPSVQDVMELFENGAILKITDNGDGTWTAETREDYPDILTMLDSTTFQISWPSAVYLDVETYKVSSL